MPFPTILYAYNGFNFYLTSTGEKKSVENLIPDRVYLYKNQDQWCYQVLHNGVVQEGFFDKNNTKLYETLEQLNKGNILKQDIPLSKETVSMLAASQQWSIESSLAIPIQRQIRGINRKQFHKVGITAGPLAGTPYNDTSQPFTPESETDWYQQNIQPLIEISGNGFMLFDTLTHATSTENLESMLKSGFHYSKESAIVRGIIAKPGLATSLDKEYGDSGLISTTPFESTISEQKSGIQYRLSGTQNMTLMLKQIDWNTASSILSSERNLILKIGTQGSILLKKPDVSTNIYEIAFSYNGKTETVQFKPGDVTFYGDAASIQKAMLSLVFRALDKVEDTEIKEGIWEELKSKEKKWLFDFIQQTSKQIFKFSEVDIIGAFKLNPDIVKEIIIDGNKINIEEFLEKVKSKASVEEFFGQYPVLKGSPFFIDMALCELNKKILADLENLEDYAPSKQYLSNLYRQATSPLNENELAALEEAKEYLNRAYKETSTNTEPIREDKEGTLPTVYRPIHGTIHTLRTMLLTDEVVWLFSRFGKDETLKQTCSQLTRQDMENLHIAMAFLVTGRESEAGHDDPNKGPERTFRYRVDSARYYAEYARTLKPPIDEETIQLYSEIITFMCHPDYPSKFIDQEKSYSYGSKEKRDKALALYHIVSLAHKLDLPRVKSKEEFNKRMNEFGSLLDGSQEALSHEQNLIQLAQSLIHTSGESVFGDKQEDNQLFLELSNNNDLALQRFKFTFNEFQLNKINIIAGSDVLGNRFRLPQGYYAEYVNSAKKLVIHTPDGHPQKIYGIDASKPGTMTLLPGNYIVYSDGKSVHVVNAKEDMAKIFAKLEGSLSSARDCKFTFSRRKDINKEDTDNIHIRHNEDGTYQIFGVYQITESGSSRLATVNIKIDNKEDILFQTLEKEFNLEKSVPEALSKLCKKRIEEDIWGKNYDFYKLFIKLKDDSDKKKFACMLYETGALQRCFGNSNIFIENYVDFSQILSYLDRDTRKKLLLLMNKDELANTLIKNPPKTMFGKGLHKIPTNIRLDLIHYLGEETINKIYTIDERSKKFLPTVFEDINIVNNALETLMGDDRVEALFQKAMQSGEKKDLEEFQKFVSTHSQQIEQLLSNPIYRDVVEDYIEQHVNDCLSNGYSLLQKAILLGNTKLVNLFLKYGADLNYANKEASVSDTAKVHPTIQKLYQGALNRVVIQSTLTTSTHGYSQVKLKSDHIETALDRYVKEKLTDSAKAISIIPAGSNCSTEEGITTAFNCIEKGLSNLKSQDKGVVIVPINWGNGHWATLAIHKTPKGLQAYYFDSLGPKSRFASIQNLLKTCGIEHVEELSSVTQPLQRDGYSCGTWCIEASKILLDTFFSEEEEVDVKNTLYEKLEVIKPTIPQLHHHYVNSITLDKGQDASAFMSELNFQDTPEYRLLSCGNPKAIQVYYAISEVFKGKPEEWNAERIQKIFQELDLNQFPLPLARLIMQNLRDTHNGEVLLMFALKNNLWELAERIIDVTNLSRLTPKEVFKEVISKIQVSKNEHTQRLAQQVLNYVLGAPAPSKSNQLWMNTRLLESSLEEEFKKLAQDYTRFKNPEEESANPNFDESIILITPYDSKNPIPGSLLTDIEKSVEKDTHYIVSPINLGEGYWGCFIIDNESEPTQAYFYHPDYSDNPSANSKIEALSELVATRFNLKIQNISYTASNSQMTGGYIISAASELVANLQITKHQKKELDTSEMLFTTQVSEKAGALNKEYEKTLTEQAKMLKSSTQTKSSKSHSTAWLTEFQIGQVLGEYALSKNEVKANQVKTLSPDSFKEAFDNRKNLAQRIETEYQNHELIIVPVHLPGHWTTLVIHKGENGQTSIYYFDSKGNPAPESLLECIPESLKPYQYTDLSIFCQDSDNHTCGTWSTEGAKWIAEACLAKTYENSEKLKEGFIQAFNNGTYKETIAEQHDKNAAIRQRTEQVVSTLEETLIQKDDVMRKQLEEKFPGLADTIDKMITEINQAESEKVNEILIEKFEEVAALDLDKREQALNYFLRMITESYESDAPKTLQTHPMLIALNKRHTELFEKLFDRSNCNPDQRVSKTTLFEQILENLKTEVNIESQKVLQHFGQMLLQGLARQPKYVGGQDMGAHLKQELSSESGVQCLDTFDSQSSEAILFHEVTKERDDILVCPIKLNGSNQTKNPWQQWGCLIVDNRKDPATAYFLAQPDRHDILKQQEELRENRTRQITELLEHLLPKDTKIICTTEIAEEPVSMLEIAHRIVTDLKKQDPEMALNLSNYLNPDEKNLNTLTEKYFPESKDSSLDSSLSTDLIEVDSSEEEISSVNSIKDLRELKSFEKELRNNLNKMEKEAPLLSLSSSKKAEMVTFYKEAKETFEAILLKQLKALTECEKLKIEPENGFEIDCVNDESFIQSIEEFYKKYGRVAQQIVMEKTKLMMTQQSSDAYSLLEIALLSGSTSLAKDILKDLTEKDIERLTDKCIPHLNCDKKSLLKIISPSEHRRSSKNIFQKESGTLLPESKEVENISGDNFIHIAVRNAESVRDFDQFILNHLDEITLEKLEETNEAGFTPIALAKAINPEFVELIQYQIDYCKNPLGHAFL